jgi:hypothetical protein
MLSLGSMKSPGWKGGGSLLKGNRIFTTKKEKQGRSLGS